MGTAHSGIDATGDVGVGSEEWDDPDEYDDDLHVPPPTPTPDETRIAAGRAADIVGLMPLNRRSDRTAAVRYLTGLFEYLPHPATHRALRRLAHDLDLEDLEAMVSLREVWIDGYAWAGEFSWKLAHRICRARWEYAPDAMIDDDWIHEWRTSGLHRYRFSMFLEARLRAPEARRLDEALRFWARYENLDGGLDG